MEPLLGSQSRLTAIILDYTLRGGDSTVGTITDGTYWYNGRFTAPQSRPDPSTVAVSVDVANVTLDDQKFSKVVLISNVSIVGEIETYRGTFDLSWHVQRWRDDYDSFNVSGTVEFGSPSSSSEGIRFSLISDSSTAQITNYESYGSEGEGWELGLATTCTGPGPADAPFPQGSLIIRTTPSEYAVGIAVGGDLSIMCRDFRGEEWTGLINLRASVGTYSPGECMGPKFVPSAPDGRNLSGSASWICTLTASDTITATLTWDLSASP